ncbi:MAG: fatty acid hydroxylase family protein [Cytophagia bacterium]|nr:fatty acid hydroxylase family protein [Cytophagia bacterium]
MNSVAFIIPTFFTFLGLEYWIAKKSGKEKLFNYESSVSNISIGIAERLLNLFITGTFYTLYYYIYENYALFNIPNHWLVWIILLLATDFVWYWYHRLGHEINLFWGAHIVHHQSEEFNYTVSARITTLQAVIRNVFWCILPFAGFHPAMVIAILVVHGTYSFFTHTQIVGKLGWIEKILVTPSHHGVHHASNEKYLNKNYGDIFIIWDKMFGTFQKEEDKPVYGLTHPLKSHSFLWQHFHYYAELWEACKRSGGIWQSIRIILGRPEEVDQNIRVDLEARLLPNKSKPTFTFRLRAYVNLQLIAAVVGLFLFTFLFNKLSFAEAFISVTLILLTLINCGALLEQQRWIYYLEIIRMLMIMSIISIYLESVSIFIVSLIAVILIGSQQMVEAWYLRFVYGFDGQTKSS